MKLFYFGLVLFFLSCKGREEVAQNGIFDTSFQNYNEFSAFEGFERISDTAIYTQKTSEDFRLLHLKKDGENVILFYKKVIPDETNWGTSGFRALDTLQIFDLKQSERFTLGYCTREGLLNEQILAVVKDTTGLYMNIVRAWIANLETQSIEEMADVSDIQCLNEFFEYREEVIAPENFQEQ